MNFFIPLIRETVEMGWNPKMVAADKGYFAEDNYTIPIREMGIKVFIPFKRGFIGKESSDEMRERLTLYEQFPDEFDDPHNAVRPKIEGVFSASKRTVGDYLWSRGELIPEGATDEELLTVGVSRRIEMIGKFIIHSLRQLVTLECIHEEVVDFKNDRSFTPLADEGAILEDAREQMRVNGAADERGADESA